MSFLLFCVEVLKKIDLKNLYGIKIGKKQMLINNLKNQTKGNKNIEKTNPMVNSNPFCASLYILSPK